MTRQAAQRTAGVKTMTKHELVLPRLSTRAFFSIAALLFAVSAALPFACCASMAKSEIPICGQASAGA
jgi:hypothetical protein